MNESIDEAAIAVGEHDITEADTLLFLHVPKTAGITLGTLIDPMWLPHLRAPVYEMHQLQPLAAADLQNAHSFMGHFFLNAMERLLGRPMTTITLLREPVARYVSEFYQLKRAQTPLNPAKGTNEQALTLDEFVWREDWISQLRVRNMQTRLLGAVLEFHDPRDVRAAMRQENRFQPPPEPGTVIPKLLKMQSFGLTERFQETLWLLCFLFGWYPLKDQVVLNRAPQQRRVDALAPETQERIRALNQLDLVLYESAKRVFQKRVEWLMHTLLERFGKKRHASETMPLSNETMHELLENHFRVRYQVRHPKRSFHALDFRFAENSDGAGGWHGLETSPRHGTYRWSGPLCSSFLVLPRPVEQELRLHFWVTHVLKQELLDSLRVLADGSPLTCDYKTDADGTSLFVGIVPPAASAHELFVHLEWQVSQTLRPTDLFQNNKDARELGIAISRVELAPLRAIERIPSEGEVLTH